MWKSAKEFSHELVRWWWVVVISIVGGSISVMQTVLSTLSADGESRSLTVPIWTWIAISLTGVLFASFLAFHKVRVERDKKRAEIGELQAKPDKDLQFVKGGLYQYSDRMAKLRGFRDAKNAVKLRDEASAFITEYVGRTRAREFRNTTRIRNPDQLRTDGDLAGFVKLNRRYLEQLADDLQPSIA